MASANIYSIADPPPIEYIPNNQGGQDIKCLNYVFNRKTLGRKTASYVCTGCYASISLKTVVLKVEDKEVIQIVEPFVITHLNLNLKWKFLRLFVLIYFQRRLYVRFVDD